MRTNRSYGCKSAAAQSMWQHDSDEVSKTCCLARLRRPPGRSAPHTAELDACYDIRITISVGFLRTHLSDMNDRLGHDHARRMPTRRTQSARIKCKLRLRKRPSCREARGGYRTPFPIACRDAIRLSLPQAKVLDRRRQGFGLVALAVTRDLCRIPLKAVVVQDFAIGS